MKSIGTDGKAYPNFMKSQLSSINNSLLEMNQGLGGNEENTQQKILWMFSKLESIIEDLQKIREMQNEPLQKIKAQLAIIPVYQYEFDPTQIRKQLIQKITQKCSQIHHSLRTQEDFIKRNSESFQDFSQNHKTQGSINNSRGILVTSRSSSKLRNSKGLNTIFSTVKNKQNRDRASNQKIDTQLKNTTSEDKQKISKLLNLKKVLFR